MSSKILKNQRFSHNFFIAIAEQLFCLIILAMLIRVIELLFITSAPPLKILTFFSVIGSEAVFILLFMLFPGCLLAVINVFSRGGYKILFSILLFLLLFLYLAGTQYYYTTQFFLDRVLFFFSYAELKLIAGSELPTVWKKFSIMYLGAIITFFILLILLLSNKLSSYLNKRVSLILILTMLILAFVPNLLISPNSLNSDAKGTAVSKPLYFTKDLIKDLMPNKKEISLSTSIDNYRQFAKLPHHPLQYEFPLMRSFDTAHDELSKYFKPFDGPPNLVFVFMEGMGSSYSGSDAYYGSMTPNLDSIYEKSLYWPNTISNTDRTHGIFANILASTPHGFERGITNLKLKEYPQMFSLSKLLCSNGYNGNFIYGGWAYFDNYEPFLKINYVSNVFEEKYFEKNYKAQSYEVEGKHSWGIPDDRLLNLYFDLKKDTIDTPYLNIILTQSLHTPFTIPHQKEYILRAKEHFAANSGNMEFFNKDKEAWSTIFYTDDVIGKFMDDYKKMPEYGNTIFVFVGDHNSQAFDFKNVIDMHHVPLAIFSPKLKQGKRFSDIVSHTDVASSFTKLFLPYLKNARLPKYSNWMSSGLSTSNTFSAKNPIYIGRFSGDIIGVIKDDILLFQDQLYEIKPGMLLDKIENKKIKSKFKESLESYKKINRYVLEENKLLMEDGKELYPNVKANFYFPE